MLLVERHHIKGNPQIIELCSLSKELYNLCNFWMRQAWRNKQPLPDINALVNKTRKEHCCLALHNTKTAKQTIRKVLTDWSNFKKTLNAYTKDPSNFLHKPKPPFYKKKLAQVIFYEETIKRKPLLQKLITPTNDCFTIGSMKQFKQVIITPKTFGFIIDVQYEYTPPAKKKIKPAGIACIDIGLNNLATITSDQIHCPLLINGRIVKSINQGFNKKKNKQTSKKRYFRLENYFHHVSRRIIDLCQANDIGKIIIGKNDGWKQNINLGSSTNQQFCSVPYCLLFQKIKYKADIAGIEVVFTEESYTSKASYLDRDIMPVYEKDAPKPIFSGKRIKRGLYCSRNGTLLNADVNGSANIGRKIIRNEDLLLRLDRSLAARPVVINPLKPSSVDTEKVDWFPECRFP